MWARRGPCDGPVTSSGCRHRKRRDDLQWRDGHPGGIPPPHVPPSRGLGMNTHCLSFHPLPGSHWLGSTRSRGEGSLLWSTWDSPLGRGWRGNDLQSRGTQQPSGRLQWAGGAEPTHPRRNARPAQAAPGVEHREVCAPNTRDLDTELSGHGPDDGPGQLGVVLTCRASV